MNDNTSRLSLDIADLPLTPFGMKSPSPCSRAAEAGINSNKLSRNYLKSPVAIKKSGDPVKKVGQAGVSGIGKENIRPDCDSESCNQSLFLGKRIPVLRKPTFSMKYAAKMPSLIEEDAIFIAPEVPVQRKINLLMEEMYSHGVKKCMKNNVLTYQKKSVVPAAQAFSETYVGKSLTTASNHALSHSKRNKLGLRFLHSPHDEGITQENLLGSSLMSQIEPFTASKLLSSTRVGERRESIMTDISGGSFVEYTSEVPEGRVIPHEDSLDEIKNKLYFTCEIQPNETKYSTSSKTANAKYGFHKLIDGIKKQKMLQYISAGRHQKCDSSEPNDNPYDSSEAADSRSSSYENESSASGRVQTWTDFSDDVPLALGKNKVVLRGRSDDASGNTEVQGDVPNDAPNLHSKRGIQSGVPDTDLVTKERTEAVRDASVVALGVSHRMEVMGGAALHAAEAHNSTMIENKCQNLHRICIPDISALTLASDSPGQPNKKMDSFASLKVTMRHDIIANNNRIKDGLPLDNEISNESSVSEDVPLAVSKTGVYCGALERCQVQDDQNQEKQSHSLPSSYRQTFTSNNHQNPAVYKLVQKAFSPSRTNIGSKKVCGEIISVDESDSEEEKDKHEVVDSSEKEESSAISVEEMPPSPPLSKNKPVLPLLKSRINQASSPIQKECIPRYNVNNSPKKFAQPSMHNEREDGARLHVVGNNIATNIEGSDDGKSKVTATSITPCRVKPLVCQWVVDSPFKDGSFDCSFLRHVSTSPDSCRDRENYHVTTMPDTTSKEDNEEEEESNSDGNLGDLTSDTQERCFDDDKKENLHSGFHVNDEYGEAKLTDKLLDSKKYRKIPERKKYRNNSKKNGMKVPVSTVATGKHNSLKKEQQSTGTQSSSQDYSLNLHLESSTKTDKTALTVGCIAKSPVCVSKETVNLMPKSDGIKDTLKYPQSTNDCFVNSISEKSLITIRRQKNIEKKRITSSTIVVNNTKTPTLLVNEGNQEHNKNLCESPDLPRRVQSKPTNLVPHLGAPSRTAESDSSDCDELISYMNKWRGKQKFVMTSDESDNEIKKTEVGDFIVTDDSSDDNDSFYLHSLNDSLVNDRRKRDNVGSVSDQFLKSKNTKKLVNPSPATARPLVYTLTDSNESLSSLNSLGRVQPQITLSDSDDDEPFVHTPAPKTKPAKQLPASTPRAITRKPIQCPNTVQPIKTTNRAVKVTCTSGSTNYGTPTMSFLSSLSSHAGSDRLHPEAVPFTRNFGKTCEQLANRLYRLFNMDVFENKLPPTLRITWNVRLTKTAGLCYYQVDRSKASGRGARIELSTKVVDSCERLRDTLIHELCHAASWIISGYKDGHGPLFKAWAYKATAAFPELPNINRCHNYSINCKYTYRCTKCGYSIGRHSKSLDTTRKVCGRCRGQFELLLTGRKVAAFTAGVSVTPKTPAPFALFVKENYGSVKQAGDGSARKHADVVRLLSQKFKEMRT